MARQWAWWPISTLALRSAKLGDLNADSSDADATSLALLIVSIVVSVLIVGAGTVYGKRVMRQINAGGGPDVEDFGPDGGAVHVLESGARGAAVSAGAPDDHEDDKTPALPDGDALVGSGSPQQDAGDSPPGAPVAVE